ncbi:MAG TPA: protein phosphatase 2C domain-containing protein [Patescibacteria group bacterium]|nr:protein phosphatase 2C domain-containing protein [Patescibacteria group bacterium]
MKVDHYYSIGSSHEECQDYALSRVWDSGLAFACVADGCSTSHERCRSVDVGARILSHSIEKILVNLSGGGENFDAVYDFAFSNGEQSHLAGLIALYANQMIADYMLSENMEYALDSTLMFCLANEKDAMIFVFGDGVVSVDYEDGDKKVYEVKYSNNAPYYVSYLLDDIRNNIYREMNQYIIVKSLICDDTSSVFDHDNFLSCGSLYVKDYKRISLMSDGVTSFVDSENKTIPTKDIVEKFTDFKNTNNGFVQRRMKKMLKMAGIKGTSHYDDISIASIVKE